jgi:DNA-binding GntR family transcriptional regulator
VSRPTLRESLQQLVHEGALVQVPYRGIHVAQPTPDELRDVAEVRMPLETMAALRLSGDPDGPAMDGVREALRSHLAAIGSGDDLEAHLTHIGLHKAIWDLADSPTLRKIWPLVGSQIHVSLSVDQAVRHDPERDDAAPSVGPRHRGGRRGDDRRRGGGTHPAQRRRGAAPAHLAAPADAPRLSS